MIDTGGKEATDREAVARCVVRLSGAAVKALLGGALPKGDALAAARVAGIMAAKRTSELIPFCHPIPLSRVTVDYEVLPERSEVHIETSARALAPTGVEMEALTAAAVAALTLYDMCKGIDPGAEIAELQLVRKTGGKSGAWEAADR